MTRGIPTFGDIGHDMGTAQAPVDISSAKGG